MATTEDNNKALLRRAVEEIWNQGNLAVADLLTDPNYVGHMSGGDIRGVAAVKKAVEGFRTAFPDVRMRIESQVAEGDEVTTSLVMEGHQTGNLSVASASPLRATGKPISVRGVSRARILGGKVVEEWVNWDERGMMEQLGAAGPPRPAYT